MPNIEKHIHQAMEEGKFENLPGKGKPLHLDVVNPHADPEWELAYRMIKDAGYSLPWIETVREIEKGLEATRKKLQLAWEWRLAVLSKPGPHSFVEAEWERSQQSFKNMIAALNQRIRDYNLQVPNARFQRTALNDSNEIGKITSSRA